MKKAYLDIMEKSLSAYMSLCCMYDDPENCVFCKDDYLETAKELRR